MYICSNYLVAPPYDHIEGPGGRVREHHEDHGGKVELLVVGPGLVRPTPVAGFLLQLHLQGIVLVVLLVDSTTGF